MDIESVQAFIVYDYSYVFFYTVPYYKFSGL